MAKSCITSQFQRKKRKKMNASSQKVTIAEPTNTQMLAKIESILSKLESMKNTVYMGMPLHETEGTEWIVIKARPAMSIMQLDLVQK